MLEVDAALVVKVWETRRVAGFVTARGIWIDY